MKILNLRRDGRTVFFTVEKTDELTREKIRTDYRTNNAGNGLFIDDSIENKQILGTAEISLHQATLSGVRKALYKVFTEDR